MTPLKKKISFITTTILSIGIIAVVSVMSYTGASKSSQTGTHFRITVVVDVKGHTYSGSTVQSYSCPGPSRSFGAHVPGRCRILGEALNVETPEGTILFLLKTKANLAHFASGSADGLARNISHALTKDGNLKAYLGPQPVLVTPKGLKLAEDNEIEVLSISVAQTNEPVEYGRLSYSINHGASGTIKSYDLIARY
ncbi:hypothetical protein [Asticcacaulis sp.]|uniref:hypothetical protein n=1 Tax=Asticcacaulis sp. TaxID=1872648 RepID=UPI002619B2CF|nr:hypothetical protein [Asticcacaulis sp.]